MKETKIYCDHCGKELDEMHDYVETEIDVHKFMEVDLCKECLNKLGSIVEEFCGRVKSN